MKIKKNVLFFFLGLFLVPCFISSVSVVKVYSNEISEIQQSQKTFEETLVLPSPDLTNDRVSEDESNSSPANSTATPTSIEGYKKLGYKNFQYSKWTGFKNCASTKSKRITAFIATNVLGFIPSGYVKIAIGIYDLANTVKTQNPDIWPTVNARNIIATAPRGNQVLIGQETIVKYYGNSSRTKLLKTITKTYWR